MSDMLELSQDIERILISEEALQSRVRELGAEISRDYAGHVPLLIGILKGSFIFMADLMRTLSIPCQLDFLALASYGRAAVSSGSVRILKNIDFEITGRDILFVEDILDSGNTVGYIKKMMAQFAPASVRMCTLLDKPARRQYPIVSDYTGFEVPDEFLVGYGLDYAENYRGLPYVGILKKKIYDPGS